MNSAIGRIRKHSLVLFVLVVLVSSCMAASEIDQQHGATPPPTLYPLPTSAAFTPSPIATSQSTPIIQIEDKCLSLEDSLPPDLKLEGVWVRQSGKPYLENLEENIKYRVPLYGGGILATYEGYWSVSPNGEWLAYLDPILDASGKTTKSKGNSIKVIHSSGYFLLTDYWPISVFQAIEGWIDNQTLLISLNGRDIVLNPFSGNWYEVKKPEWLGKSLNEVPWFDYYQYSPRLDRVIENLDDHSEVRDFKSGKTIFGDSELGFFGETTWSPDGSMLFLATGEDEIFHILKDDKEILKIDLTEVGIFGILPQSSYDFITNASWSLDNQRILLETPSKTLVLDINKQKSHEICFADENINKTWGFDGEFFSSRDGQYIIIQRSLINEKPYVQRIDILVDIENMRAYRLPDIAYKDYIGWLALP